MHMDSAKQQVECEHHGRKQIRLMNTARLKILSCKTPEYCMLCAEDALMTQDGGATKDSATEEVEVEQEVLEKQEEKKEEKKKKKKKKKKGADHLWVCLECSKYFCDGADSVPHGHIRDHWKQSGHCWAANYENPTLVHCFKCRHDILIMFPDLVPKPNEAAPSGLHSQEDWIWNRRSDPSEDDRDDKKTMKTSDIHIRIPDLVPKPNEAAPSGLLHSQEDSTWEWSSNWSWDSLEDDWDDKTTKKTSVHEKQLSTHVQGPSHASDDNLKRNQSPPLSKDDTAISVSAGNQTETHTNVIRGLRNLGNSCFFNVILQSLLASDSLRSKLIGTDVETRPLAVSLKQLFIETSSSDNRRDVLDPVDLFTAVCTKWPLFEKGKMDDAEALLTCFLSGLQTEEASARNVSGDASNVPTIIDSIFVGQECSILNIKGCTHGSRKPENILIFQLPIPQGRLPSVAQSGAHDDVHDRDTHISLEDCFSLYTVEEELSKLHCESCTAERAKKPLGEAGELKEDEIRVYRTATKRLLIAKAPEVLIITIRRYKHVSKGKCEKLEGHLRFKEFLDIGPYREEDQRFNDTENMYRLFSVAQHRGDPNQGHYVAYIRASKMAGCPRKSNDSKSWFFASDDEVREVCLQEVLNCEAYVLFYERCPADTFQPPAIGTGEESRHTDTDLWPQRGGLFSEPIPLPQDFEVWDQQWSSKRDKRREQKISKGDAMLLPKFWDFLDRFMASGSELPYYRFILAAMIKMGLRSGELNISYKDLMSHSMELAMDICNGYARLQVMLLETARKYIQQWAIRLGVIERDKDVMQKLELNFFGMPQMHKQWKQCFDPLLSIMDVFDHSGDPIMVPLPDKCALVQSLIAHVISNHRGGYSWEGDFGPDDIDVLDGKAVITKIPKLFVIKPMISAEIIDAMHKDFNSIATAAVKKFSRTDTYVPYLKPFITLLTGMSDYADWWLTPAKAEVLREWIQHFPFLKPAMARSNLLVGIFTACRSYDEGDTTQRFKVILENTFEPWLDPMLKSTNKMVSKVFHHKDPDKQTRYYKKQLKYLFELLRHLAQHGTEKSFDKAPPAFPGAQAATAPRKQLVRMLDELEIAGAYELEKAVVDALFNLLQEFAMNGMLKSVWECYKFCNYPYRE